MAKQTTGPVGHPPRANTTYSLATLPTGCRRRRPQRHHTPLGTLVRQAHYWTKVGPDCYEPIDARSVRNPLLTTAQRSSYRRQTRTMAQVHEIVKGLLLQCPELISQAFDVLLLESVYQMVDDPTAAFMRRHRSLFLAVFSAVSASMVQTASSHLRLHDGDIEVHHANEWWEWALRSMPRLYILDCLGLPRTTRGPVVVDPRTLTQAQLDRFIRMRLFHPWVRIVRTASALTNRANIIRTNGNTFAQQNLPAVHVATPQGPLTHQAMVHIAALTIP